MSVTQKLSLTPMLKVVIVGDSGVGKTNILSRYIADKFLLAQNVTIGVEFSVKELVINGQVVKMQIWDTAGQDRYRSLSSIFYKNAIGAMVVFDLSNRISFEGTTKWIRQIRDNAIQGIVLVLIGNKCDLGKREITTEEALQMAQKQNMAYFQTSAATGINIIQSFNKLSEEIYRKYKQDREKPNPTPVPQPIRISKRKESPPKPKCCA